jgi:outer membrane protein
MYKRVLGVVLVAAGLIAGTAQAAQGEWMGRARAIGIQPNESSSPLALEASNEWTVELDFSYFVTKNLALELILATKKHDIKSSGVGIGDVALLPPTLTLQYHFNPDEGSFRPYVGVGLNYTKFYDINLGGGTLTVDSSSWGPALQLGVDIPIGKNLYLNLDVKKIWIGTDVKAVATSAQVSSFDVEPIIYGVGVGMRW